jgi:curli biogenesis system outer membrane secretion channel CsgG
MQYIAYRCVYVSCLHICADKSKTKNQAGVQMMEISKLSLMIIGAIALVGCATETSRSVEVAKVEAASTQYRGARTLVAVGKFENRSTFMRGIFTDGIDRLGGQAKSTLIAHLQQSQRFNVLDRDNLAEGQQEAQFKAKSQSIRGADYLVTGDISEFGRKDVGDHQLFGLLGRGKSQIAYAKITLNIVNSLTSEVVYSARGAGEFELSNREIIGFGGTAGYDATLNGKVLDLAMREAVNNLVKGLDGGQWTPPSPSGQRGAP